jgi:hypothetical protein
VTMKGERREARQRSAKRRQPRHGASLAAIYANAVLKRARGKKRKKR